ncbi:hypothetical protein GCM10023093_00470 [Nemorincola caseinilytica]|uniref:Ferritin-like metal-binding protein YciE n=1 Tax=Nemorincola caseinilytica TaxID=2054315 RepID=A0ABP8N3V9_9BACT
MRTATSQKNGAAGKTTANAGGSGKKANPASATKSSKKEQQQKEEKEETPFEKLFMDMLKDMYWAEQHLVKALEKMSKAATTEQLQDAFDDHLYVTKKHASRLERVFGLLGAPVQGKKCAAMEGLVNEAEEMIKETEEGSMTRDAALIIAAQKVEHYEIASYGSLVQVALTLGHNEAARLLEKTLNEEEDTDRHLTMIAESDVNPLADQETEDEGAEEEEEMEEA